MIQFYCVSHFILINEMQCVWAQKQIEMIEDTFVWRHDVLLLYRRYIKKWRHTKYQIGQFGAMDLNPVSSLLLQQHVCDFNIISICLSCKIVYCRHWCRRRKFRDKWVAFDEINKCFLHFFFFSCSFCLSFSFISFN